MVSPTQQDPSSPRAVAAATFSTARRGYQPAEVSAFLKAVASEMMRLRERISQLQGQLAKARAAEPEPTTLDEATMLRLLGEETSRVLTTARASASEIKARAEAIAATVLGDAHDEGNNVRNQADLDAARIREQAHADGRVTVERAREEARAMAIEVREYRERVLADLNRRTALAKEQIGELLDGRDRLLQVFERARLVAIDVTSGVKDLDLPTEYVNLTPTTGPVPVMVKPPGLDYDEVEGIDIGHETVAAEPVLYEPEPVEVEAPAPRPEPSPDLRPVEQRIQQVVAEPEIAPVVPPYIVESIDDDDDFEDDDVDDVDVDDVDVDGDYSDEYVDEYTATEVEKADDDAADDAVESGGAPDVVDESDAVDLDVVVVDTLVTDVSVTDEVTNVVPFQRRAQNEVSAQPDTEYDDTEYDAEYDAEYDEAELVAESTEVADGDDDSSSDPVGGLFARLRAEAPAAPEVSPESDGLAASETDAPAVPSHDSVDASAVFAARAKQLSASAEPAARKLKRVLADEQNEVLQVLRTGAADTVDDLLPPPQVHAAAYLDAVTDEIDSTAAAAAAVFGATKVADVTEAVRTKLIIDLIDPLRHRLDRAVRDNGGDNDAIAKSVRSVYREWKTKHIDSELAELLRVAFANSATAAIPKGVPVVWTPDPEAIACAECEDNSLGGAVPNGQAFPTGHTSAPAHGGCRCLPIPN